eukprot:4948783-Alexandrium_andersonii.AAC.1
MQLAQEYHSDGFQSENEPVTTKQPKKLQNISLNPPGPWGTEENHMLAFSTGYIKGQPRAHALMLIAL